MDSITRMTAMMFEIPIRMLEFPFLMLAVSMDTILSDGDMKNSMRKRQASISRTHGIAKRVSKVKVVPHVRHAA